MKTLIIVLSCLFIQTDVFSQVRTDWITVFYIESNLFEFFVDMSVDNSGSVYITGNFPEHIPFVDYGNIVTKKCDSAGVEQWSYMWTGGRTDFCIDAAGDKIGNFFVSGISEGATSSDDYALLKLNSAGQLVWTRGYNGPGNSLDRANSVTLDSYGNIYVTGSSMGNGTNYDFATIKYNSIGALKWLKRYSSVITYDDFSNDIAVDKWRNVFIVGTAANRNVIIKYDSLGNQQWLRQTYSSLNKICVDSSGSVLSFGQNDIEKYSANGDSLWSVTNVAQINDLVIDSENNILIAGKFLSSTTGNDIFTRKINSSGLVEWTRTFNCSGNQEDEAFSIAIDQQGNSYITGSGVGEQPHFGVITLKYDSEGILQWSRFHEGSETEAFKGLKIVVGEDANVIVGGEYIEHIYPIVKFFAIKYSPSDPEVVLQLSALIEGYYNESNNTMVRDTMYVYLRNSSSPYSIVDTARAFLNQQGTATFTFTRADNVIPYYIAVKHRNSLETWSSLPITFNTSQLSFDFTLGAHLAYGYNLVLKGSKYCVYSGNVNNDGIIDASDLAIVDNDALNSSLGYVISDVNGDFFVDGSDLAIVDNNSYNFIGVIRP